MERLLLAVWAEAIAGDNRSGQQALRIVVELGKVTGVSRPMRAEPAPAMERPPVLVMMSQEEWLRRYEAAWAEVQPLPPEGVPEEDDS